MNIATRLDALPGFRRRFVVNPAPGRVRCDLEDDYHRMGIVLRHDGEVATSVEAEMIRIPWTTCPGARAVLARTFAGVRLDAFAARGEKTANCTHLFDLAMLAAAHAHDTAPLVYDILVADPVEGVWRAELRRDGTTVLAWNVDRFVLSQPAHLAGMRLDKLRPWIDTLDQAAQEQARLFRWGTILAHGRGRQFAEPAERQRLPLGQCFTFQRENAPNAMYIDGSVRDFGVGRDRPLADLPALRVN
jgi:hypothetical protein